MSSSGTAIKEGLLIDVTENQQNIKILYEYRDSPVRYFVTYHINLALKLITLIVQK